MTAGLTNAELVDRVIYYTIILGGGAVLAVWLLRTSLGRTSLVGSKPRRHEMPVLAPLVALCLLMLGGPFVQEVMVRLAGPARGARESVQSSIAYSVAAIPVVAFVLLLAHFCYARGIKGLGLRLRTIPRGFARGALCLLAVLPLVMAVLAVIEYIGRMTQGQGYQIPEHEKLKELSQWPAFTVRALVIFTAVVVAPVQEEMLFRGVFQTFIRSYINRPWPAIAIAALLFASVHVNQSHWPALFVLALGMGYTYEKSGSLWQPIFVHALFNGAVIVSALAG
jgi:membrane protease YdiL (CAAX protease family)